MTQPASNRKDSGSIRGTRIVGWFLVALGVFVILSKIFGWGPRSDAPLWGEGAVHSLLSLLGGLATVVAPIGLGILCLVSARIMRWGRPMDPPE
ncbi:hypothetical protein [Mariniluteicoccus flavus]